MHKQKKYSITLLLSTILLFSGCNGGNEMGREEQEQAQAQKEQEDIVQVLHVHDGDTFSVWMNEKVEDVRVIGIDTPETGEKYRRRECFGRESTQKAIELLGDQKVRLESDHSQADRDEYDRLLRYVFLEDGTFFNLVMIEGGFAKEYTFKGSQYKYQSEFIEAQKVAKEDKKGLWETCKQK